MANTDAPFGFQPYGKVLRAQIYAVATAYGTAIYIGDAVECNGTSYNTWWGGGTMGCAVEETGAAGSMLGSVLACFDYRGDPLKYLPATTTGDSVVAGYCLVADHPEQLFVVQEDGDTTPIAAASIGLNVEGISSHTGSTTTGRSKMEIDSDTVNTTNTLAWKVMGVYKNDEVGSANCRFIVKCNSHWHGAGATGIS